MKTIALEEHFGTPVLSEIRREWYQRTGFPQIWNPGHMQLLERRQEDVEEFRLPEMDANGVAVQVLSIGTPGVQWLPPSETKRAILEAARFNDAMAGVIRSHPTRFKGFATLPMQDPEASAVELERSVTQLGFVGAMVHGHTNGEYLDEPKFSAVWERAQALDVPIYLHPTDPLPDQIKIYDGHPELLGPPWNWGVETGTHALRIIFGGVFDRYPKATLILGHMGEMLPFFLPRINVGARMLPAGRSLQKLPSDYIKSNVVITTTGVLSHESLICAVTALGAERVLFSVDYPYVSTKDSVHFLETAPVRKEDRERIAHGNAERLLKLA